MINMNSTREIMLPHLLSAKNKESFAYVTIKDRLPIILTKVLDSLCREKILFKEKYGEEVLDEVKNIIGLLSQLKNHIQTNKPFVYPLNFYPAFEYDDAIIWKNAFDIYRKQYGQLPKWFDASWLFSECYMYKRIQEAFQTSQCLSLYDPFFEGKRKSLEGSLESVKNLSFSTLKILSDLPKMSLDTKKETFFKFLQVSLWGNMHDLSISAGSELNQDSILFNSLQSVEDNILVSDMDQIWSHLDSFHLISKNKRTIGLILDNAGFELISDLCLLTFLIEAGFISAVHIYLKTRPWFVSDTTRQDFDHTLGILGKIDSCSELVALWRAYLDSKKWILEEQIFWTTPHDFSLMNTIDPVLYEELQNLQLLLFKGDLNYRKLVGDYDWPIETRLYDALRGFLPSSLAALRTIKGGAVVGLQVTDGLLKAMEVQNWRSSGCYATIQFCGL